MGNYPAASFNVTVEGVTTVSPYLQHAGISFVPSTSDFLTGFTTSVQAWMFPDPVTNLGLVAALTPNTWQTRLKSLGATSTEPVWRAVAAHFFQLQVADANGVRAPQQNPEVVYIGRRTRAVPSVQTVTFSTNTAGTVRVRVNPAKFIHAGLTPAGALADVTITADGVKTVSDLATELDAALTAVPGFTALYNPVAAAGVVTITSVADGYPLIVEVTPSTPGPAMLLAVTTANVAGDYALDLDDIQTSAELGDQLDPPTRRFYWLTDLQADDVVNLEGMAWVDDQSNTSLHPVPNRYIFLGWSTTGAKVMTISGDQVGNFNPSATASLSQNAQAALANAGYYRAGVIDHDRWEFVVPALLGRCIGYLPGEVSFTSKVLYGSTADSRMTGRSYGDNESLALNEERSFSWYSAEGPRGSFKYAATPSGEFFDRPWLADFASYQCYTDTIAWQQLNNILAYDDDTILGGRAIIATALTKIPAVNPATITISYLTRAQVDPNDIANREYKDYMGFGITFGIINRIGTVADPISITLKDAG